jgi:hypothetical protein
LIMGAGRKEVLRKGRGEEARSVRCMCDVCVAHGDRAADGVDVDAQGSGLCEDETHFPLNARIECRAFVSARILVGFRFALACRKGGSIPRFPDEPVGKEDVEARTEGAQRCLPPRA